MSHPTDDEKKRLAPVLEALNAVGGAKDAAGINYLVCMLVLEHMKSRPINYNELSSAIAAVGDAHDELKGKLLGFFEGYRAVFNGNIFEEILWRIRAVQTGDAR